jgi:magnesium-transporting ATPase (P-type)
MQGGSSVDIRFPMGLMFAIVGAIIAVYGGITNGNATYEVHSFGININLWWGIVLLLFGLTMLALAWKASKKHKST